MKTKFFILFLFTTVKSFSQVDDLYQPPLVFKQNHVKLRMTNSGPLNIVDHFDKDGLLIQRVYTLPVENKYKCILNYTYDGTQNLLTETSYTFTNRDSTGKEVNNLISDTFYIKIEHGSLNRVIKIINSDHSGKTSLETSYKYEPFVETKIIYRKSIPAAKIITEFEKPFVKKRESSLNYLANGENGNSYFMDFKNKYDRSGKITRQVIKNTSDFFDSFHDYSKILPVKYEYIYDDHGLLISFIDTLRNGKEYKKKFKYEFW